MKQTTIARRVETVGIGLHKGEPIRLILEPLDANSGIILHREDLGISFKAEPKNVINTQMATVVGNEKGFISTIEHLMAAVNGYGIDNIRISVDANEIPVMDGSAISFCMLLDEAGIRHLDAGKKVILVRREVEVVEGSKFVRTSPSRNPKFDYTIKFDHPVIGEQRYLFEFSKSSFVKNIARATHILNPEGLRFENEFVRHKILDAVGDLSLLGAPLLGEYTASAGSHDLNHKLTLALMANEKNYEIATLSGELLKEYQKVFA